MAFAGSAVIERAVRAASASPRLYRDPIRDMVILHPGGAPAPIIRRGHTLSLPVRARGSELGVVLVTHIHAAALRGGSHALKGTHGDEPQPRLLVRGKALVERLPCISEPLEPGGPFRQGVGALTIKLHGIHLPPLTHALLECGQTAVAGLRAGADRILHGRPGLLLLGRELQRHFDHAHPCVGQDLEFGLAQPSVVMRLSGTGGALGIGHRRAHDEQGRHHTNRSLEHLSLPVSSTPVILCLASAAYLMAWDSALPVWDECN